MWCKLKEKLVVIYGNKVASKLSLQLFWDTHVRSLKYVDIPKAKKEDLSLKEGNSSNTDTGEY